MLGYFDTLSVSKPLIIGIVNVTPDSFSDGGEALNSQAAIKRGLLLHEEGADIIDVGGESTRPGALPITIEEEIRRVIPVIEQLANYGLKVSVDTRHSEVMSRAVESGAEIINDVSALTNDPRSLELIAKLGVAVILMHMRGSPLTMQQQPQYKNAPLEIRNYLAKRIETCVLAGIKKTNIAVDPGLGFGKSLRHNLQILNKLELLVDLGYPIVLGASRKSFIGLINKEEDPKCRLAGSLAVAILSMTKGVNLFRVHDVLATRQALDVARAIGDAKI